MLPDLGSVPTVPAPLPIEIGMTKHSPILWFAALFCTSLCVLQTNAGEIIFQDQFERTETDDQLEQVGNGWQTNSKSRAKGNKQVDLVDGALHIYRHDVADHGVSVVQDMAFKNAKIAMRFRIGKGDELGINIADMKEKSVHAGHLCVAKIRTHKVSILDMKTGRMNLKMREKSQAKTLTAADKQLIASKEKSFPVDLEADQWHDLKVEIADQTMTVTIDGKQVGQFTSPGIGHNTKSRLRLAVAKEAWVDDITVVRDEN
ncbi:DUF1080 domain-containing protein [Stieleria sp. TO1_6]|uniref:family 16 glycoside hydrolase n=1 Tax=Stieleria tagensis TaxID=2956795 RepID=UPI00209AF948|nr:family 16 glycoside hydrolase [Stieleria tagensis]MCO8120572.1 DUF1080 domain-containing protein [Stieleria tagensis]